MPNQEPKNIINKDLRIRQTVYDKRPGDIVYFCFLCFYCQTFQSRFLKEDLVFAAAEKYKEENQLLRPCLHCKPSGPICHSAEETILKYSRLGSKKGEIRQHLCGQSCICHLPDITTVLWRSLLARLAPKLAAGHAVSFNSFPSIIRASRPE